MLLYFAASKKALQFFLPLASCSCYPLHDPRDISHKRLYLCRRIHVEVDNLFLHVERLGKQGSIGFAFSHTVMVNNSRPEVCHSS